MICLFLLLAFTHSPFAVPVLPLSTAPPSYYDPGLVLRTRETSMLDDSRTIWDIVCACLATIFACTWVAVHPDIPSPKADWKTRFKNQLVIMVNAWIAPECVTMWAMRQFLSARKLSRMYNERHRIPEDTRGYIRLFWGSLFPLCGNTGDIDAQRWTLAHGFFAQMGGYMIFRENKPYRTLCLEDVDLERDINLVPYYTEAELMDRSKGDAFSKGIVLLQTLWFTLTLAFATLNIATYTLWWHKPLNVQCPIRVYEAPPPGEFSLRAGALVQFFDDRATLRSSPSNCASEQLSTPTIVGKNSLDATDVEWDELHEIPWFPCNLLSDDRTTVEGGQSSKFATLATIFSSGGEEDDPLELAKEGTHGCNGEYGWEGVNELPWFPATEVPLILCRREAPNTIIDQQSSRIAPPNLPNRAKWHCRVFRKCTFLPDYFVLFDNGGWYTVHLYDGGIKEDDEESALDSCNRCLSIDCYMPLLFRDLPWIIQMCILVPFWFPYVVLVTFYALCAYPLFVFLFSPLASMMGMSQNADEPRLDPDDPLQVPTFYAGPPGTLHHGSRVKMRHTIFLLTFDFGAIHALGWSAHYPSKTERMFCCALTLCMCGVPTTVALWLLYSRSSFPQLGTNAVPPGVIASPFNFLWVSRFSRFLAARSAQMAIPIYVFGRIALIVVAFTSLRNLPPETFKSVAWTSGVPHS